MSESSNALNSAGPEAAQPKRSQTAAVSAIGKLERLRTTRARIQIPLFVYSPGGEGMPFYEEAHTIEINANGALIAMRTVVLPGERLLLVNKTNQRDLECVMISIAVRRGQDANVVIAFDASAPQFWGRSSGMLPENLKGENEQLGIPAVFSHARRF